MTKSALYRWTAPVCILGAVLALTGCYSSSSTPYTLVAQLGAISPQAPIVAATIDVNGPSCAVRIVTLNSVKAWTPVCFVTKDQPTYKSFSIGSQHVDFGAVGGSFKVLSTTMATLPAPASTATTAPNAAVGPAFPDTWNLTPYPGHVKLQGQNTGFMVTSAILHINGSQGMLDVTFKTSYLPLHLDCTVTTNDKGDYTLLFNPAALLKITSNENSIPSYNIVLSSEGQSLAGNIWDSRGFDTWTPSLPPQWAAVPNSSN